MIKQIIQQLIPYNAQLVAVSKTKPNEAILELYEDGQRIFGENKVQELVEKYEVLPKDIQWHLIGHLQTNKVKYIAPFVSLIHSVDSLELLQEINKQAKKHNRVIACLLQIHIAQEDSKFGIDKDKVIELVKNIDNQLFTNIKIIGIMGMATFTEDKIQVANEFKTLKNIFDVLKNDCYKDQPDFREISMGMSDDYALALENGSTMVRIGSLLFGKR